jgi:hypothetical protein
MGQFKPMVKMMTTEPTVELKLKKGGHVNMKKGGMAEGGHKKMAMGGGALDMMSGTPALVGRPAVNAPVRAPGKPSMASRRKAMMAKPAMPAPMPPMKKGGKAEGGESKKTHMAEMSKMKGLEKELKSHESKPASKGHKGLKTGGVALGNAGGFKKGGMATGGVKLGNAGGFKDGGMSMVEKDGKMVPDFAADGKGKMKMGGMATGGVKLGNAGGFKMGGKSSKKAYAAGGTVNSGKPVAMPQGAKKPSQPVSINQLSGTFKKGGKVTPPEGKLMKAFGRENVSAMKSAKAQSNDIYSKFQKMAGGGSTSDKEMDVSNGAYDAHYAREKAENEADRKMMTDALMYLPRQAKKAYASLTGQGAVSDKEKSMSPSMRGQGSVTETEKSITVSPAGKKRGGRAC